VRVPGPSQQCRSAPSLRLKLKTVAAALPKGISVGMVAVTLESQAYHSVMNSRPGSTSRSFTRGATVGPRATRISCPLPAAPR